MDLLRALLLSFLKDIEFPHKFWFFTFPAYNPLSDIVCAKGIIVSKRTAVSPPLVFCLLLLFVCLVSCSREEAGTPTTAPTIAAVSTATATPQPTATPTSTPQPTPVRPSITVADQPLAEDGRLTITSVVLAEPAWLAIHAEEEGQVGEVLGYTAVAPGTNHEASDITVTIDPTQATSTLIAILHVDAGEEGEFEFPGADEPLQTETSVVSTSFAVDLQFLLPAIDVSDQEISSDGVVSIDSVYTTEPGWVVVHTSEAGEIGDVLGYAFVTPGNHDNVVVPIRWRQGSDQLHAVLYEDEGEANHLDYPDEDLPVLVNGEPVVATFAVTYPPDVLVYDQPVLDGKVVIERAVSNGPGWLVIYFEEEDAPGLIIGFALLEEGVNERIVVPVVETAVTPQLYVMLHEDAAPLDEFNVPGNDVPVTFEGRVMTPVSFRTNPGNYLITRDQPLTLDENDNTANITVPLVVTDLDAWLVLYNDSDGELGDVIGQTWLSAGLNRDVVVEIDPEQASEMLHATLHIDTDTSRQFDYPDGADVPLRRNRQIIRAPLVVLPE